MSRLTRQYRRLAIVAAALSLHTPFAAADTVTEWNVKANEIVLEGRIGPPIANRMMAILYTAAFEAANAVSKRYPPGRLTLDAPPGASAEAAIAAVHRVVLGKTMPQQQAAIDAAYQAALAKVPDGPARAAGIALGEKAAQAVLDMCADDGFNGPESYRPHAAPGRYVPTAMVAVPHWPQRRPWVMSSASQLRPSAAPPDLKSEQWARDYNEIKGLGARTGSRRSAEQTQIASFWEATLPSIYHGVVRSVADQPGRDLTRNARLFAAVGQATDDALVAVFDAKYHYNFWRPVTAIRNGDIDGNDATERDGSWLPFIETPMHPEYPCAHCTVAGAVGAVLRADIGAGATPRLTTTSYTARGVIRSWNSIDEFVQEVGLARIYDGVHYRFSTEVGSELGRRVGELAAAKVLQPSR
jgi:PAP2 superfamily